MLWNWKIPLILKLSPTIEEYLQNFIFESGLSQQGPCLLRRCIFQRLVANLQNSIVKFDVTVSFDRPAFNDPFNWTPETVVVVPQTDTWDRCRREVCWRMSKKSLWNVHLSGFSSYLVSSTHFLAYPRKLTGCDLTPRRKQNSKGLQTPAIAVRSHTEPDDVFADVYCIRPIFILCEVVTCWVGGTCGEGSWKKTKRRCLNLQEYIH